MNNFTKVTNAVPKYNSARGAFECIVVSLQAGENYFFRILASNSQGPSPPSKSVPIKVRERERERENNKESNTFPSQDDKVLSIL
jgi:hypothetical protein